jgi:hypothetical protein
LLEIHFINHLQITLFMLRKILFLCSLFCASFLFAQKKTTEVERCATMKVFNEKLKEPGAESIEQFENWLQTKMRQAVKTNNNKQRVVITIPYIVHVIHNGEPVGTTTNIPLAWIQDQMLAMNRDFRKNNPDLAILPTVFQPAASDFELEFCPAVVDPLGNILTDPGVNRVDRNLQGWAAPPYTDTYFDANIKPATIWNTDNYLNIWVANLSGGVLGYATFPSTTILPGLTSFIGTTTTDGVVIQYNAFGDLNVGLNPAYNKGRTLVHEVGHWLGLRHVWGDATCGTDYCVDTPTQTGPNFGCPIFPSVTCANGPNGDMFYNYMDYGDDACIVCFTGDQKARAVTIMNNSPRRLSLQSSTVCALPGINVGVTAVVPPCSSGTNKTVDVTIKNKGISTIAIGDVSVNLSVSGGVTGTYAAITNTVAIPTNGTATLTFTNVNLNTTADITIQADATLLGDVYAPDNTLSLNTNLGTPLIASNTTNSCSGQAFAINLTNPKPSSTGVQWESSPDNVTFTPIVGASANTLTTSQTADTYYRCVVGCGANNFTSNVLQVTMAFPNTCYCAPSYSSGCGSSGNDAMTNVVVGTMSNASGCAPSPYYTFFNNVAIPDLSRCQPTNFSITFGADPSNYFAIWIDSDNDGTFSSTEIVATGNGGANATVTSILTVPTGTYVGQTRMRIRGGDDSALSGTQACGTSSSIWGETEDYIVNIVASTGTCYCTTSYSSGCTGYSDDIRNVTYSTLNNSSLCTVGAYTFYNTATIPNITRGAANNFSITFGTDPNNYFAVWIDADNDGIFTTAEMRLANTAVVGASGSFTGSITIPAGTYNGQTRMRVRGGDDSALSNTQPCGISNSSYGETEDYIINIVTSCATPSIGTIIPTDVSAPIPIGCTSCAGPYIVEYGLTGFTPGVGATAGVGGAIFTTPVLTQTITGLSPGITYDVYVRQKCGTSYSPNGIKKTFTTLCGSNLLPYSDSFNDGVLSSCWQNVVVNTGAVAPALTVVASSTFPTAVPAQGSHMIKFNSRLATTGTKSRLVSKALNTLGVNSVDVSFQMFEDAAFLTLEDKVTLQYSLNGTTWFDVETLVRPNSAATAGTWYTRTFTLPDAVANKASIRVGLLFTSSLGNNVYIDNFKVYASPAFANFNNDICNSMVMNNVSGKNTFRFRSANALVAEVNPNGNNLGTVTLRTKENLSGSSYVPSLNNGQKYMPRYFDLKSTSPAPFAQPVNVRFLFHNQELDDLNTAINGAEDIYTLLMREYAEPNGGTSSENCITSDNIAPSVDIPILGITNLPEGFMYEITTNHFVEFGAFPSAVLPPIIHAKVFLANVNATTNLMTSDLKLVPNFPLSDPYDAAPLNTVFVHVASGPTATTTSTVVNTAGNNAVVDWVFIELREGTSGSSTVAYTRAALLQADGDIVDVDGSAVVAFPNAVAGNYFVGIRHRNHLGFRTDAKVAVSSTTPFLDFTNGSQVLYGITPVVPINATRSAMNGGDSNKDGSIDSSDSTVWEAQNGAFDDYSLNADYNMDGSVDGTDSTLWELNNGKYQELD